MRRVNIVIPVPPGKDSIKYPIQLNEEEIDILINACDGGMVKFEIIETKYVQVNQR